MAKPIHIRLHPTFHETTMGKTLKLETLTEQIKKAITRIEQSEGKISQHQLEHDTHNIFVTKEQKYPNYYCISLGSYKPSTRKIEPSLVVALASHDRIRDIESGKKLDIPTTQGILDAYSRKTIRRNMGGTSKKKK